LVLCLLLLYWPLAAFFNIFYITEPDFDNNWLALFLIDIGTVAMCVLVSFLINRNYILDLKSGIKEIKLGKVCEKLDITDYEAGSGSMYIPGLGDLFPKIWGQEMKAIYLMKLKVNNDEHDVEKELFDKVNEGDLIEIHYATHSQTLLGIELSGQKI
jgi:hypothetical protein